MEKKYFEELAQNIVESTKDVDGEIIVEVCRNSKKDKQMNYYESITTIVGNVVEYTEDGELQTKNSSGKITGSISHKALTKNYDVLTASCNGEFLGGYDVDLHNENVKDLVEKKEFLVEQILNLSEEQREAAILHLVEMGVMAKVEETEDDVE